MKKMYFAIAKASVLSLLLSTGIAKADYVGMPTLDLSDLISTLPVPADSPEVVIPEPLPQPSVNLPVESLPEPVTPPLEQLPKPITPPEANPLKPTEAAPDVNLCDAFNSAFGNLFAGAGCTTSIIPPVPPLPPIEPPVLPPLPPLPPIEPPVIPECPDNGICVPPVNPEVPVPASLLIFMAALFGLRRK